MAGDQIEMTTHELVIGLWMIACWEFGQGLYWAVKTICLRRKRHRQMMEELKSNLNMRYDASDAEYINETISEVKRRVKQIYGDN